MGLTSTNAPDNYGMARGAENVTNLVLTFPVAASQSLAKGDFVVMNATGLVSKNATKEVAIDGICMSNVNNLTGADADKTAPVLIKGITEVDCLVGKTSSSAYNGDVDVGEVLIVGESATATGQVAVAGTGAGVTSSANKLGVSLDELPVQATADKVVKIRLYVDRFSATYTGWN